MRFRKVKHLHMRIGVFFFSCKERLSVMKFSMVDRWFCLGTLPLLLTLSSRYEYGVEASNVTFAFDGFSGLSDVYTVEQDYQVWTYNSTNFSINANSTEPYTTSVAGRFLYPTPVQMRDPLKPTVVKSFRTTFVFQILIKWTQSIGPGLAFIIVPDNITVGANMDYMGFLTAKTAGINKTYVSDDHTVGVELDTHMNEEFNDPNDNHVCIDVASMNSTEDNTFIPTIPLATENAKRLQQLWIDYDQVDSRMTIYHAQYGQPKPVTAPLGSQVGVNLTVMKEYMYVGFSTSYGYESSNLHSIWAWSFSNAGEAPQIRIRQDVGSAPPASPPPPPTPTPPAPSPNLSPPSGPILAPVSPSTSFPPQRSPTPQVVISPPLSPTPVESDPPSLGAPSPPSPSNTPPPLMSSPALGPSTTSSGGSATKIVVGVVVGVVAIAGIAFCYWWYCIRSRRRRRKSVSNTILEVGVGQVQLCVHSPNVPSSPKFHIFISYTAGEDGDKANFPVQLYEELKKNPCYEVFIDRYKLSPGTPFPDEIMEEFRKIEVGMGVGIVVVTREYFEKRWPMIELVEFVKLLNANGTSKVRILPLFFELKPATIREHLKAKIWEAGWSEMSTENHPVNVEEYRNATTKLCSYSGVEYKYDDWSRKAEYIQLILDKVKVMHDEMLCSQIRVRNEGLVTPNSLD